MKKRFAVTIALAVTVGLLTVTNSYADTFQKYGNNGTASCSDFCARSGGTPPIVGACLSGEMPGGKRISCNITPGHIYDGQLICECSELKTFVKYGNNGTATCNDFCGRVNVPPGAGACVRGENTENGAAVGCNQTTGQLYKG